MMDWGIAMMAVMILFWVAVIVGVVWLVRGLLRERRDANRDGGESRGALGTLERRYAEGEIDVDEYRERRSVLERDG